MIKSSGEKAVYASGYQRDTANGKVRYSLIPLEPLKQLAEHYTKGAELYGDNNWRLAIGEEEMARFKESAWRHFIQFMNGEEDENHGIAAVWNIFALIYHNAEMKREAWNIRQIDKGLE